MAALSLACMGTYEGNRLCPEGEKKVTVHEGIPFSQFRSGITWQAAKPIADNGKVVVYQDYLFVLEPFVGVHVFDNRDNENPRALGFLAVPGNSDILIKDDVLYLDSYTDLVKIAIIDGQATEVGRVKLAFGDAYYYDEDQVITRSYYECQ
ncbi:MAG TPA: hypothetical protein VIC26_15125 [Marinagarivorans sp.]